MNINRRIWHLTSIYHIRFLRRAVVHSCLVVQIYYIVFFQNQMARKFPNFLLLELFNIFIWIKKQHTSFWHYPTSLRNRFNFTKWPVFVFLLLLVRKGFQAQTLRLITFFSKNSSLTIWSTSALGARSGVCWPYLFSVGSFLAFS